MSLNRRELLVWGGSLAGISAPGETPNRPPFIPELNTECRMETLAHLMAERGYSTSRTEKILGKNLARVYRDNWS